MALTKKIRFISAFLLILSLLAIVFFSTQQESDFLQTKIESQPEILENLVENEKNDDVISFAPPSCPTGKTGGADLCNSTRIPRIGDTIDFTVNSRILQAGNAVTIYYGGKPGADGSISNSQILKTGTTDSAGMYTFSYTIPSSSQWGEQIYFMAHITIGGAVIRTNLRGITVIPKTTDADWLVTPSTYCQVQSNGSCTPINNSKPIEAAYKAAKSGDVILLEDGTYAHFQMKRGCHSQTGPIIWIMARNVNGAIIDDNPVGGSDTIEFTSQACYTSLVGLQILGDDRAAMMFSTSGNEPYKNIQILESTIDGKYDWYTGTGFDSKWAVQSYLLTGFLWRGGTIKNIREEHAFYVHNSQDDFFIEDMTVSHVGRTALQMTSRASDCYQYQNPCPEGKGNVQVRNVNILDAGLGDYCAGGFALTFAGRNTFNILIENTYIESGLDPALVAGTGCLGTGELVVYAGGGSQNVPNGPITVRDSVFLVAANQGNKELSEISYTPLLTLQNVTFTSGKRTSLTVTSPTDNLCLDRASNVGGNPEKRVRVFGQYYATYDHLVDAYGECQAGTCGNGVCDPGETSSSCSQDCSAVCGNGQVESGEQCDDGNTNNDDGCHSDCSLEYCGNNRKEGSEQCDGTDSASCPGLCNASCACGSGNDSTPPTGSVSINAGASSTNNSAVTLNLTYSDNVAVKDCAYANENKVYGAYETCQATKSWTLTKQNGTRTVYYIIRDTSDTTTEVSDTITLSVQHSETKYDGSTTNLSTLPDPFNISNLTLENTQHGKIQYTSNVYPGRSIDFDLASTIASNSAAIDSANYQSLNIPATISLYNISWRIPVILKDGQACAPPTCTITSYTGGTLEYSVTGFSSYSSGEGDGCTDGDGDGYYLYENGICDVGNDCSDSNPAIHPSATDICEDGIDQDCSGGDEICPLPPVCGNNICEAGENNTSCFIDCPLNPYCGDGICSGGESSTSCTTDCPTIPTTEEETPAVSEQTQSNNLEDQYCAFGTRKCGLTLGACGQKMGVQNCINHAWSECVGAKLPTDEVCDGADNDCDGTIDESNCSCATGDVRACGSNVGRCQFGKQFCHNGTWSGCSGGVKAALNETCENQVDDTCNGEIDEGCQLSAVPEEEFPLEIIFVCIMVLTATAAAAQYFFFFRKKPIAP